MRNNSCCALDVASRGLQCFTMQPGHREKSVVLSYAIPIISCPVVDFIHSIFCDAFEIDKLCTYQQPSMLAVFPLGSC